MNELSWLQLFTLAQTHVREEFDFDFDSSLSNLMTFENVTRDFNLIKIQIIFITNFIIIIKKVNFIV